MDLGLQDQVALVAAASRGLGKAAALHLAREGARLSICARSTQLDETAREIEAECGMEVLATHADLTRPQEIEALVRKTLDHYGHIDILILNSGGPAPGGFLDLTAEDWQAAVAITLMSAVRLCYAVVPSMTARRTGSIVASQSISVRQPIDRLILSNSLRMAVIGLMKSLANELGPLGIRVNSINPTWTSTERVDALMADRAVHNQTSAEEEAAKVIAEIPLGRMGTVEEYGRAIAWLASPAASFIHGQAVMFDGGELRASL